MTQLFFSKNFVYFIQLDNFVHIKFTTTDEWEFFFLLWYIQLAFSHFSLLSGSCLSVLLIFQRIKLFLFIVSISYQYCVSVLLYLFLLCLPFTYTFIFIILPSTYTDTSGIFYPAFYSFLR